MIDTKPRIKIDRTWYDNKPFWKCIGSGWSGVGDTPQEAFECWKILSTPLTEEQTQKARKALSRISYDTVKIQKDCESLPDVAILCGKNLK